MLDTALKTQLKAYLEKLQRPIVLVAALDDTPKSQELHALLRDIAELSPKVTLVERSEVADERTPSFAIGLPGEPARIRFAGVPMGHEFTSLVLALLQTGGHPPKLDAALIEQIRALEPAQDLVFETYMSLSCQNCPEVVQALNLLAVLNPRVRHVTIDGALFQDEIAQRQIMAVPTVYLNGQVFGQGRMGIEEIVAKLDSGAAQREAVRLHAKPVFDMLIVGGGPAGAAAAVYAARKGIRTGVVAERFGGQTLDTLGIENFISVKETEGPKFAVALEQHVREYEVDVMNAQRVERVIPADEPGAPIGVQLANGATLRARSVVVSTGARWREVGVPGEREYRNRGVAYCPHCDGPLFKGKRVAVIGGGNSGVEAAIDLAGIVREVTLLEFAPQLRADAVLVRKLESLPNVRIVINAQTTEITGADGKVNGLRWRDRTADAEHDIALEGVFVQIGLQPNTEWLRGTLALSKHGEIIVDARGATSLAGVFAAGDVTTVPFKQIIIAAGDGAKAALGAFDHLIRTSVPEAVAA
ncbi:alkyl hydroperoxide reductase subunit F [Aquincola sp. S2]|uniref:Alkyl hydroperoxide reductase subunit F n=1 Tax=Pseudaquabacterium terrae TaxID=2732868 RepID=A0ABX2EQ81_9BURK|nr:alkyl hydroperoxide reductase subunit F [Aquabacterium terrae]NRF70860.1 alkyl hydroperoxide reductase subunit F [Aquabacterium terrae]